MTIEIYTDGSCLKNPGGPGGWAFVIVGDDIVVRSGGEPKTTNNRQEIMAILEAVLWMKTPATLKIYSDSQYAIGVLSGKWNPQKNLDLIAQFKSASKAHKVSFEWVRGHDGNEFNEIADVYAGRAARQYVKTS